MARSKAKSGSTARKAPPKKPPVKQPRVERVHWLVFGHAANAGQAGFQVAVPNSMIPKHKRTVRSVTTIQLPPEVIEGKRNCSQEPESQEKEPEAKGKKDELVNYTVTLVCKGNDPVDLMKKSLDGFSGAILDPKDKAYSQTTLAIKRVLDFNRRATAAAARRAIKEVNELDDDIFSSSKSGVPDLKSSQPAATSPMGGLTSPLSQRKSAPRALCSTFDPAFQEFMLELDRIGAQYATSESVKYLEQILIAVGDKKENSEVLSNAHSFLHTVVNCSMQKVEEKEARHVLKRPPKQDLLLPSHFLRKGDQKVVLFEGKGIYVTPQWMAAFEMRVENCSSWQEYVDKVLYEMYPKETLMWLSSKGLRRSVGIDSNLYSGLLDHVSKKFQPITQQMLTEKINTLTCNVRTGVKRRLKEQSSETPKKNKSTPEKILKEPLSGKLSPSTPATGTDSCTAPNDEFSVEKPGAPPAPTMDDITPQPPLAVSPESGFSPDTAISMFNGQPPMTPVAQHLSHQNLGSEDSISYTVLTPMSTSLSSQQATAPAPLQAMAITPELAMAALGITPEVLGSMSRIVNIAQGKPVL